MLPPPFSSVCRSALALSGFSLAFGMAAAQSPAEVKFRDEIQPLLEKYCYDCHGDGVRKGNVAFDRFASDAELVGETGLWHAVLKNVRAGIMPAEDGPRPSAEEIERLSSWIKFQAFGIDPAHPDPGRVTLRRLNRVEYRNTIRDLMGIEFDSEVEFPPDDTGQGFDNLGEVLTVSPLLLEKYLQAAEEIVNQAIPRLARVPVRHVAPGREFHHVSGEVGGTVSPDANAARKAAVRNDINARRGGAIGYTFPVTQSGTYKLSLEAQVRSSFDFDGARGRLVIAVDGKPHREVEIAWGAEPVRFATELDWTEGSHQVTVELHPLTPVIEAKSDPVPLLLPGDAPPANTATVGGSAAPASTPGGQPPGAPGGRPPPVRSVDVRVVSAELVGPMAEEHWVKPSNYTRFFPRDTPTDPAARDAYTHEVLRDFITKAFRRPADEARVAQLAAIARSVQEEPGQRFEDGIARAVMAVLASPRFLFRIEDVDAKAAADPFAAIDEHALATRLSYFLWSTMPDDELFALARRGELRQQLPTQIARMLRDPKSQEFVKNFPGQWLQARDIETVPINARAVLGLGNTRGNRSNRADFNSDLRKMMREETERYFEYVLREDRSVLEFIDSDYTFLNARLAQHYGLPAVEGEVLRRVTLPAGSPRGGMLTQGTMLAVTSNPTRTSPVKRGLFILENFLGTPPPPAPPDIPALEDSQTTADGKELPLREALAAHRNKALCSSCHSRMDPLGFALENFNAMGNWRDLDANQPIDPAGQLVTGEAFKDIRELKRILTQERRMDYYHCLTEKMLTYALGRGLEPHDTHTIDQIVAELERDQGRMSTLVHGIIASVPFQKQRNPRATALTLAAPASTVPFVP